MAAKALIIKALPRPPDPIPGGNGATDVPLTCIVIACISARRLVSVVTSGEHTLVMLNNVTLHLLVGSDVKCVIKIMKLKKI